jgi:hypothetical protein
MSPATHAPIRTKGQTRGAASSGANSPGADTTEAAERPPDLRQRPSSRSGWVGQDLPAVMQQFKLLFAVFRSK